MNKYKIEEILSNIQFQVYSDMNFIEPLGLDKETWKELLEYINKYKIILDKIKEYVNKEISLIDKDLSECELTYSEKYNFENAKNKYINILELLEEIE